MFNVQTLIDEIVVKNNQTKSGKRDKANFHVSDAGTCYRKRYYKRLGIKATADIPVANLRKMLAGDAGHTQLQWLLKRNGNLVASEGEVKVPHVVGHFDAIIKEGGTKTLLEIKTIEKFQASWIKKSGAKPEHKMQMFSYWTMLRQDYKDLDNAVLTYVKREDFEANDYYFKWDESITEQVHNEWAPLIKMWEEGVLPECTCKLDYGGAGPKYCRYSTSDTECCSEILYAHMVAEEEKPIVANVMN